MLITNTHSFCLNKPVDKNGKSLPLAITGEYNDFKNGIQTKGVVKDPFAGSIFYSKFLIMNKDRWVTNSYLNYGLFPLTMVPECYQASLNEIMKELLDKSGLTFYELTSKPLMKKSYDNKYLKEIWVYRDELSEFMGTGKYFLLDVYNKLLEV